VAIASFEKLLEVEIHGAEALDVVKDTETATETVPVN
jgi:hypothetical protein